MATRLPDLQVVKVAPTSPDGMWIFATIGAWRATETEPRSLEFVSVAKSDDASVILRTAITAYYHAGPAENRLGVGHTFPIGEGWVDGSPLEAVLVSLPYLWGPRLEHCQLTDRHIQVLWLLPIYETEREFGKAHGLESLEQRFERAPIDYLDHFRPAVA
jgi:hypothetical protein